MILIKSNQIKFKSAREPNVEPPDCLQGTTHHRADSGLESKPAESTNFNAHALVVHSGGWLS